MGNHHCYIGYSLIIHFHDHLCLLIISRNDLTKMYRFWVTCAVFILSELSTTEFLKLVERVKKRVNSIEQDNIFQLKLALMNTLADSYVFSRHRFGSRKTPGTHESKLEVNTM